jgi:hypothetical protein
MAQAGRQPECRQGLTDGDSVPLADIDELLDAIAAVFDLPPAGPLAWTARSELLAARAQHVRGLLGRGRARTAADVRSLAKALRQLDAEPGLAVTYTLSPAVTR